MKFSTEQAALERLSGLPGLEHRRSNRNKLCLPVRIRPEDSRIDEEVRTTKNSGRGGLYFTTWRPVYYVGMRVRVTFPYPSAAARINQEVQGEIVRVEMLPDMRWGVALRITE